MCCIGNDKRLKKLLEWTDPERRKRWNLQQTWIKGIRNTVAWRNFKYDDWKAVKFGS